MLLKNKVAVITGSGKGIGRQIALDLAGAGARVVVADASRSTGEITCKMIKDSGGEAIFVAMDVSRLDDVEKGASIAISAFGGIDILVCNAGITSNRSFLELSYEEWDKTITVNLTGTYLTVKGIIPYMLSKQKGKILIISSSSAITGSGGGAHYASSKAGQHGLLRNLARELAPRGITVNAIAPRVIETDILDSLYPPGSTRDELIKKIPVGRFGRTEDVSELAVFLASDNASYINGQIILLDGGRTFS